MRFVRCDSCEKEEPIHSGVELPKGWWQVGTGHERGVWGGWVLCSWACVGDWAKGPAPDPRSRVPEPPVYAVPAGYKLVKPPRRVPLAHSADVSIQPLKSSGKTRRRPSRRS